MSEPKPYRLNVGIALFNADGRVLIGRRFRDDGPEIILPGLEWQMPQGGVDEGEDHRAAAFRELWEETSVRSADYLGETDWLIYEFPPFDNPSHRLAKFRGQRQKWFALRFTGGVRCLALGAPRPRRRSRGAVPPRGLSRGCGELREIRAGLISCA
jgi:putative (di)nucleoside polyphosphate hydrolase